MAGTLNNQIQIRPGF